MARFKPLLCLTALAFLLTATPVVLFKAAPAFAEGTDPEAGSEVKAPVHKKRTAKPKAKAPAAAVKPAGPVPYTTIAAPPAQHVTPGPPTVATTTDALPQPVETNKPIPPASDVAIAPKAALQAPPPPPPPPSATTAVPNVAPNVSGPAEISLRCETQVRKGDHPLTTGVFFIDLFPSAVFPDEHADFKFAFVDPSHKSLIRDSICLDAMCPATVTGSAYYLVSQTTRHGSALRITLDRAKGAFYAEEVDQGLMGMFRKSKTADHYGEQGYCVPQHLPNALF